MSFAAIVALPVVLAPAPAAFSTDDDDDDWSVVVIISALLALASLVVDGADNDDEESSATLLFDVKGHFCAESSSSFLPLLVLIADHDAAWSSLLCYAGGAVCHVAMGLLYLAHFFIQPQGHGFFHAIIANVQMQKQELEPNRLLSIGSCILTHIVHVPRYTCMYT